MDEPEEDMLGKSGDVECPTRNMRINDFTKDMKVQLVDPKDIPGMKYLTQKFYFFRKKLPWQSPKVNKLQENKDDSSCG